MRTRTIGSLEVSVVGVGCNNFGARMDDGAVTAVVDAAIEHGVNFFDTADIYGGGGRSEELLGSALAGRRDEVVIATKFGGDMGEGKKASADYVMQAVEASLSRLGTDRIDLYQLHFPDASTPITETLGALDELVTAGKVREIGCSNFTIAMLDDAWSAAQEDAASFVSVQNQMSVLERTDEAGVLLECERLGISYLPYFPLAHGLLTGKYRRGEAPPEGTRIGGNAARSAELLTDEMFDRLEALTAFAAERDHSLLDVAFAWLLAHRPVASVIAGATKPEQIAANAAAGDWDLSEDDLAEIARIA